MATSGRDFRLWLLADSVATVRRRMSRRNTLMLGAGLAVVAVAFIFWVNPGAKKNDADDRSSHPTKVQAVVNYTPEKPPANERTTKSVPSRSPAPSSSALRCSA